MSIAVAVSSFAKVESHFGVCSHPFAPRERNIIEPLFAKMGESKTGWLRTDFVWGMIDKNGSYDFSVYDNIVNKLAVYDISVLGIITEARWGKLAEENLEQWTAYITATVAHFKGRVDHWEIINEPDHPVHQATKDENKGRGYGKLLKVAYDAVKKGNPNAKVLTAGFAGVKREYIEEVLKVAGDCYDIMNFHTYPAPKPPEKRISEYLNILKETMQKYGGQKPVWLTEIGSTTPTHSADALPIVRAAIAHLDVPVVRVFALQEETCENMKTKAKVLFPEAKKIKVIKYAKLKNLRADSILLLPTTQEFNHQYGDDIVDYVRRGGTLVYSGGGYPFIFNTSPDKKNTDILGKLRISITPHWKIDKKMPSFIQYGYSITKEFEKAISGKLNNIRFRTFDYSAKASIDGDEFIPVVKFKWNGVEYTPVAIYKYNNDILGKVILVSSFETGSNFMTEERQAEFLTRFYLFSIGTGIEKIFNYNFRSHGEVSAYEGHFGIVRKDLSEKPSFFAYRNAVELLDGARDVKLTKDDAKGIYSMSWKTSDNRDVRAYWSLDYSIKKIDVKIPKGAKIVNHLGEEIDIVKFAKAKKGAVGVFEFEVGFAPVFIIEVLR